MSKRDSGPWPKTEEELLAILHEHETKRHDYGSVAESLAEVTIAMFNYFASKQGMTGFQAGWAGLVFLRKVRGIEGPFGIIEGSKMLYPQYDIEQQLREWIEEWKPDIGKMAREKLSECDRDRIHPNVLGRWVALAAHAPKEADDQ